MSRWQSKQVLMWISPTSTSFYHQERERCDLFANIPWSQEGTFAQHVEECLQQLPKTRCVLQIILDDSLARFWKVEPPQQIAQLDDLRAAARIRFEILYDLPVSNWIIEADWNATEAFLACAIPADLMLAFSQRLNQPEYRHIKIACCDPTFIYYWNHSQKHLANHVEGFGVVGTCTMTVALIHNARITAVRCLPLTNLRQPSLATLDREIQNLSLQLELQPPSKIWLTGNLPDRWQPCRTSHIKWRRLISEPLIAPTTEPEIEAEVGE